MEGIVVNHLADPQLLLMVLAKDQCHVTDHLLLLHHILVENQQEEKWHATLVQDHHRTQIIRKRRIIFQPSYQDMLVILIGLYSLNQERDTGRIEEGVGFRRYLCI